MGILDNLLGGFSLESLTPMLLKEMKKSGSKCFVAVEREGVIEIIPLDYDPVKRLEVAEKNVELLKQRLITIQDER